MRRYSPPPSESIPGCFALATLIVVSLFRMRAIALPRVHQRAHNGIADTRRLRRTRQDVDNTTNPSAIGLTTNALGYGQTVTDPSHPEKVECARSHRNTTRR